MVAAVVFGGGVAARAESIPVRAGDTIVQGNTTCTLGYVYRSGGATMGLTAGHCAEGSSTVIRDADAAVSGTLVGAAAAGRASDWELIDFGDVAWSPWIRHTPYWVSSLAAARAGQAICHYGVGSQAVSCGTTLAVNGASIVVDADGVPGDSGGPCFVPVGSHDVSVIGLWHGHADDAPSLGYCVSTDAALIHFGENQRA
jgi:V8-like Glu-specific endopeptidase